MTQTTANPQVPLPAGAECTEGWQHDEPQAFRVIHGATRGVGGHKLVVWSSAIQFADGTLDEGRIGAPYVWVDIHWEDGLTSRQARDLAAELVAAAAQMDLWVTR
jgi:hypothetical protein